MRQGRRSGGVGKALLEMAEQTAKGRDRVMELNVHKDNKEVAEGFYRDKCGFAFCGDAPSDAPGDAPIAWVMRRKLS